MTSIPRLRNRTVLSQTSESAGAAVSWRGRMPIGLPPSFPLQPESGAACVPETMAFRGEFMGPRRLASPDACRESAAGREAMRRRFRISPPVGQPSRHRDARPFRTARRAVTIFPYARVLRLPSVTVGVPYLRVCIGRHIGCCSNLWINGSPAARSNSSCRSSG